MRRLRLGSALAGMALSVAVCAALWPHARDASAILAAQDDPAALSDIQHQFRPAEATRRWSPRTSRRHSPQAIPISPTASSNSPATRHCRQRRTVEARQRCRY
jgi:hypothetical protein